MKKLLITLFAVVLLLTAGATAFAEEADLVISGANVTAMPGQTVEVPIVIEKNSGFCGLNLQFTYSDALTLVSFTNAAKTLNCTNITTTVWDGSGNYTETGNLAVLKFTVPETAEPGTRYPVRIRFIEAYDWELNDVTVSVTAGSVTVGSSVAAVYENGVEKAKYGDFETAVKACGENSYVKLLSDIQVNGTLTGDLYVDLNGSDLTGTLTGGKIYGMDSTTDDYSCQNRGTFRCTDASGQVVIPQAFFKSSVTGALKWYMAVGGEDGYTFHRYYAGITKVSIRTGDTGFGYKAVFYGDEMVLANIDSFGFKLNLAGNDTVIVKSLDASKLEMGREYSLLLKNFDIAKFGETDVNAEVFLNLKTGDEVTSSSVSYSMKTMLQRICQSMTQFTNGQITALRTMCQSYADIMKNWGMDALVNDK